jgi:hypothetical protein
MFKALLVASLLGLTFVPSAFAEDAMKCNDTSMMKMKADMDKMIGTAMKEKKTMAMKEMDMAKKSMEAKKMDECAMHMGNAEKAMKKM